ncbi:MAG: ChbG/HpnK family deacetylase, partial [Aliifodinibius sp.]|nr:ChbG/HpnK family deacetylase [Fodinibius sp.]
MTTAENRFLNRSQFQAQLNTIDPQQVMIEWREQIEKFIKLTGRKPTHLDSHHHTAYYTKNLSRLVMELAREYGCALRHPNTQKNSPLLDGLPKGVKVIILNHAPSLLKNLKIPTTDILYT